MAVIKPYDTSQLRQLEKAIRDSDLGVNPTNDGQIIRVVIPQLSEERRREMAKIARGKGEDARVTVRNIRRKAMEELHRIARDGEAGEDEVGRAEKELQGTTDRYVHQIDDLVKHKESELLKCTRLPPLAEHAAALFPRRTVGVPPGRNLRAAIAVGAAGRGDLSSVLFERHLRRRARRVTAVAPGSWPGVPAARPRGAAAGLLAAGSP